LSETKGAEEQAKRQAQLFKRRVEEVQVEAEMVRVRKREILDNAPILVSMADANGTLYYLNTVGRKMMGLDEKQELSGLTLIGYQQQQQQQQQQRARLVLAPEALSLAERYGVWSGNVDFLNQDGLEVKYHLTLIAHRGERGLLRGYSLLGSDMTGWGCIEAALEASKKALQASEINMSRITARHLTIQEEERRRIALDLHDGLGQTLSLLKMSIQEMERIIGAGIERNAANHIEHMKAMVTTAVEETRLMSTKLRPALIDDLGIVATLGWYFRDF